MFDGFMRTFRLRPREVVLSSPLAGKVIPLSEVNDETFAAGLLGDGVAIRPTGSRVVAPADAKIEAIFPTGHALALRTVDDFSILIHLGLDTVRLQGEHFKVYAEPGDTVSRGDVLIEFDGPAIAYEGYDTIVPVLIRNTLEFSGLRVVAQDYVDELDDLLVGRIQ
ncbi:PTS glucose transporter subunit IIA [Collinsella sp. zg1085]|uniref:PTS sugar transporter subunit IIA n=1 Tax=Collinsella sp. zg1085 TaxID=2844380 RepID=UPI001C0D404F|nr:PTS glucose transporter subunit IIA [Collinsella sp. zg1085]QWT17430.1 PTS glucose transporter subunit IIA [Collinsella sp. zg1085]